MSVIIIMIIIIIYTINKQPNKQKQNNLHYLGLFLSPRDRPANRAGVKVRICVDPIQRCDLCDWTIRVLYEVVVCGAFTASDETTFAICFGIVLDTTASLKYC